MAKKKTGYGRYEFTITIASEANTPEEAWAEACDAFSADSGTYPEDYKFEKIDKKHIEASINDMLMKIDDEQEVSMK